MRLFGLVTVFLLIQFSDPVADSELDRPTRFTPGSFGTLFDLALQPKQILRLAFYILSVSGVVCERKTMYRDKLCIVFFAGLSNEIDIAAIVVRDNPERHVPARHLACIHRLVRAFESILHGLILREYSTDFVAGSIIIFGLDFEGVGTDLVAKPFALFLGEILDCHSLHRN